MKKYLTLLIGGFIFLFMFAVPGNYVKADSVSNLGELKAALKNSGDCGCPVTHITGNEKNKIVAKLLASEQFKDAKKEIIGEGYLWRGVDAISVVQIGQDGPIGVMVPFYTSDGKIEGAAFIDGEFAGKSPYEF